MLDFRITLTTLLCCLFPVVLVWAEETDLTPKLLQDVWMKEVKRNFILAPFEAFNLYENLYTKVISPYGIFFEDFFIDEPAPVTPIKVSNTLHVTDLEEGAQLLERFRKALKARLTERTLQHMQTTVSESAPVSSGSKLVNDVTMIARWTQNFQKRDTHKHSFHDTPHSHVYIDFMYKDDIFNYANLSELNATALELRLQENLFSLLFLRPHSVDGLTTLLQKISSNLSLVNDFILPRLQPTVVRAMIPKFQVDSSYQLNEIFDEYHNASIPPVNTIKNKSASGSIQSILQKCRITVNEQGVGGFDPASEHVLFWNTHASLRVTPIAFDLNQPFLFIVSNKQGFQLVGHVVEL